MNSAWYTYDANGRVIEEKIERLGKKSTPLIQTTTNKYNAYGRLVESIAVNDKGKTVGTWTFTYDATGTMTGNTFLAKKKPTAIAYLYEYDATGNWIKLTTTTDGDTYVTERKLTYY
jgi:hypothetical protein